MSLADAEVNEYIKNLFGCNIWMRTLHGMVGCILFTYPKGRGIMVGSTDYPAGKLLGLTPVNKVNLMKGDSIGGGRALSARGNNIDN